MDLFLPPGTRAFGAFLALPAMNGPLPAEPNIKENTVSALRTVYVVAKTPNFIQSHSIPH